MSRVEDIDTGIWSDPDFTSLSPIARAVYVWSWTNSHCGMAGIYKIDRRLIEFETGWTGDQLEAALAELQDREMAFYDGRVMYVKARTKRLRSKSPNIAKRCARDVENVGVDHPFAEAYLARYSRVPWLESALQEVCSDLSKTLAKGSNPSEGSQGNGKGNGKGNGSSSPTSSLRSEDVEPKLDDQAEHIDEARERLAAEAALFAEWQERCQHPAAKFSKERRACIRARRKSFDDERLARAIYGASVAAYVDESGKRHDDLTLVFRNDSKVEDFIERADRYDGMNGKQESSGRSMLAALNAHADRLAAEADA